MFVRCSSSCWPFLPNCGNKFKFISAYSLTEERSNHLAFGTRGDLSTFIISTYRAVQTTGHVSHNNLVNELAHLESPIAQRLERPTGIWKVIGSTPVRKLRKSFILSIRLENASSFVLAQLYHAQFQDENPAQVGQTGFLAQWKN